MAKSIRARLGKFELLRCVNPAGDHNHHARRKSENILEGFTARQGRRNHGHFPFFPIGDLERALGMSQVLDIGIHRFLAGVLPLQPKDELLAHLRILQQRHHPRRQPFLVGGGHSVSACVRVAANTITQAQSFRRQERVHGAPIVSPEILRCKGQEPGSQKKAFAASPLGVKPLA